MNSITISILINGSKFNTVIAQKQFFIPIVIAFNLTIKFNSVLNTLHISFMTTNISCLVHLDVNMVKKHIFATHNPILYLIFDLGLISLSLRICDITAKGLRSALTHCDVPLGNIFELKAKWRSSFCKLKKKKKNVFNLQVLMRTSLKIMQI